MDINRYKYYDNEEQHLHTLDLAPLVGTSTVLSVVAKPLTYWAAGLAVAEFGWLNPKKATPQECDEAAAKGLEEVKSLDIAQYKRKLDRAYRAHAKSLDKSAKEGKDLHAELERYVKNHMVCYGNAKDTTEYDPDIQPFIDWTHENVEKFLYSEGHCYSEVHWIGGISDAGAILKDGSYAIIDFKSSREAYDTQFWQIGGYDIEISENGVFDKDGNFIWRLPDGITFTKHIVVPFGAKEVKPIVSTDVRKHRVAYMLALELYKIKEGIIK